MAWDIVSDCTGVICRETRILSFLNTKRRYSCTVASGTDARRASTRRFAQKPTLSIGIKKLERNIKRDQENILELEKRGWRVLVVWECETKKRNLPMLTKRIGEFIAQ
jgi:DNA G:T-mismatch repair endonuclease